jgi:hypothetical protein
MRGHRAPARRDPHYRITALPRYRITTLLHYHIKGNYRINVLGVYFGTSRQPAVRKLQARLIHRPCNLFYLLSKARTRTSTRLVGTRAPPRTESAILWTTNREHEPLFSAKAYGHGYNSFWSRSMSGFGHDTLLCVSSHLLLDLLALPEIRALKVMRATFGHNYRTMEEDPPGEQRAEP